jgi:hypothetical protein
VNPEIKLLLGGHLRIFGDGPNTGRGTDESVASMRVRLQPIVRHEGLHT